MRSGKLQRMSAGAGIRHSAYDPSQAKGVHLLQLRILPERESPAPRYEQEAIPNAE